MSATDSSTGIVPARGLTGNNGTSAGDAHERAPRVRLRPHHISIATVADPIPLARFLDRRDPQRLLVFCDEAAEVVSPIAALSDGAATAAGIDVLIGPERGFAEILQRVRRQGARAHLSRSVQGQQGQQRQWRPEVDHEGRRLLQRMQQASEGRLIV